MSGHKDVLVPLRQLQYRSYKHTILIYHFSYAAHSLQDFERACLASRAELGFVSRLISEDRIIVHPVGEGDEVPKCYYEVAYLARAFQNRGSALGFRIPGESRDNCKIEWFCFSKCIEGFIQTYKIDHIGNKLKNPFIIETKGRTAQLQQMTVPVIKGAYVFDNVAILERGGTGKKGTVSCVKEHRDWFDSLKDAGHPNVSLKLNWRNRGTDKQKEIKKHGKILPLRNLEEELTKAYIEVQIGREGVKTYKASEGYRDEDNDDGYADSKEGISCKGDDDKATAHLPEVLACGEDRMTRQSTAGNL